jgi:hypothetical protein
MKRDKNTVKHLSAFITERDRQLSARHDVTAKFTVTCSVVFCAAALPCLYQNRGLVLL